MFLCDFVPADGSIKLLTAKDARALTKGAKDFKRNDAEFFTAR